MNKLEISSVEHSVQFQDIVSKHTLRRVEFKHLFLLLWGFLSAKQN